MTARTVGKFSGKLIEWSTAKKVFDGEFDGTRYYSV